MLTARAQNYEWAPSDHDGLSQDKVAAALSGLFDPQLSSGLLCLAGMFDKRNRVRHMLWRAAYRISVREKWDLPRGPGPIEELVDLALFEATGPSVPCNVCDGSGINPHPWKMLERRSCSHCEGRGRLPKLEMTRAEIIGVGKANWYKTWMARYAAVYGRLNEWVQGADEYLRVRLNRESQARRNFR